MGIIHFLYPLRVKRERRKAGSRTLCCGWQAGSSEFHTVIYLPHICCSMHIHFHDSQTSMPFQMSDLSYPSSSSTQTPFLELADLLSCPSKIMYENWVLVALSHKQSFPGCSFLSHTISLCGVSSKQPQMLLDL